ncbi:hypothetical protein [Allomesorhizobium alhagi]|jgi:hypothetical protein|uniref:Uncharacterized protein n=1 Tax=Mesorhizobium alhagi CCNWXJ12-2 TaxID=1107882 RepID=H0HRX1_9HYPH|nr:hypothetical protein [Mesorhizobium alhagi]EHK56526.1 hypothetical protein MAXJ12_14543 [Mesorhizobium alhagi CCNWXJ12-2]
MGMILTGIVVAIAIAIGAGYFMNAEQRPSWEVYSTPSSRVGDPGHNLVGTGWTGEPESGAVAAAEPEEPSS